MFLNSCDKHSALLWTAVLVFVLVYTYSQRSFRQRQRPFGLQFGSIHQLRNYVTFWAVGSETCLLPPCNSGTFLSKTFASGLKRVFGHQVTWAGADCIL